MERMYEVAVCWGWSGERESAEEECGGLFAVRVSSGAGGEWSRRRKPRKGDLGEWGPGRAGDCE